MNLYNKIFSTALVREVLTEDNLKELRKLRYFDDYLFNNYINGRLAGDSVVYGYVNEKLIFNTQARLSRELSSNAVLAERLRDMDAILGSGAVVDACKYLYNDNVVMMQRQCLKQGCMTEQQFRERMPNYVRL